MNRSVVVIFTMGVLAMVMLTVFGSFFVGKVGGVEHAVALKEDLRAVFGAQMVDPTALEVKVIRESEQFGVLLRYAPAAKLAERDVALDFHLRRVSEFVLSRETMRKHTAFVRIDLVLPGGRLRTERFFRRGAAPPPPSETPPAAEPAPPATPAAAPAPVSAPAPAAVDAGAAAARPEPGR